MAAGQTQDNTTMQPSQTQQPDYNKDYWAPDRKQVLQNMGITDTYNKTWNGSTWVDGGAQAAPSGQQSSSAPNTWSQTATPAGFDQTKWNDPNKHDPKYDVGHMVASGWSNDQISAYMQAHPEIFSGYNISGKDTITDKDGNIFDFRLAMDADPNHMGTAQWTGVGGPGFAPPTGGISGGYQQWLQSMGLGGSSAAGTSLYGQNPGAFDKLSNGLPYPSQGGDLFSIMMAKAGQNEIPSASDPIIKAQADAYDASQQRARRNYLADLAERSGPNANMGAEARMTAEQLGQNDAQFQATLMGNELQQRRQQIMQALQMGAGFLTDEQRLALQQQLGLLSAYMQQQQITNQNNQFLDNLGMNYWDRSNYWDAYNAGY